MDRLNRSFNIPPGIWLFWKLLFKFPPTRAKMLKMPLKCPSLGSLELIKCPYPGDISQADEWQKDGRNAFSVEQNPYKYRKWFAFNIVKTEKHCWRIYYEQNSRAKRREWLLQGHWMLSFSSYVMQHTTRFIKKIPPTEITTLLFRGIHLTFMTISLTCIIAHLIKRQSP